MKRSPSPSPSAPSPATPPNPTKQSSLADRDSLAAEDPIYDDEGGPAELANSDMEKITQWDEPVDVAGHRVDPVPLEDDTPPAVAFVDEGVDVAEDELRSIEEDEDDNEEAEWEKEEEAKG